VKLRKDVGIREGKAELVPKSLFSFYLIIIQNKRMPAYLKPSRCRFI